MPTSATTLLRGIRKWPLPTGSKPIIVGVDDWALRKGRPKKAICAVAASILTAVYHMIKDGTAYANLRPDHFQRRAPKQRAKAIVRQIERVGFT